MMHHAIVSSWRASLHWIEPDGPPLLFLCCCFSSCLCLQGRGRAGLGGRLLPKGAVCHLLRVPAAVLHRSFVSGSGAGGAGGSRMPPPLGASKNAATCDPLALLLRHHRWTPVPTRCCCTAAVVVVPLQVRRERAAQRAPPPLLPAGGAARGGRLGAPPVRGGCRLRLLTGCLSG